MAHQLPSLSEPVNDNQDEAYNSASDEDFDPTAAEPGSDAGDSSASSDDETETPDAVAKRKLKRKAIPSAVAEVAADFENSGDEATISSGRKRKRGKGQGKDGEGDSGGEGGLIKTRAQRRAEAIESKPLVEASKASVDVDALWAQLAGAGDNKLKAEKTFAVPKSHTSASAQQSPEDENLSTNARTTVNAEALQSATLPARTAPLDTNGEATVTIERTYDFAGQTMTEQRTVLASSAEARLYLQQKQQQEQQQQQKSAANPSSSTSTTTLKPLKPGFRRPTKRPSMFDSDANGTASAPGGLAATKGVKLNTLQKSKLDWAQHVDHEGLTEELDEHSKAKGTYLGRMDFLGRMEAKREEDLKKGRGPVGGNK